VGRPATNCHSVALIASKGAAPNTTEAMRVVVDTSVWSLALRRNTPSEAMPVVNQLRDLIVDGQNAVLDLNLWLHTPCG